MKKFTIGSSLVLALGLFLSFNGKVEASDKTKIAGYTCNKLSRFIEFGVMLDTKKPTSEKNTEFANQLFINKGCK